MTTRERERAAAAVRHDLDRTVDAILQRGGDRDAQRRDIHTAYTGRYDLREKATTVPRCPRHPHTTPIGGGVCPLCGPET